MLENVLPRPLRNILPKDVFEVRLRRERPIVYLTEKGQENTGVILSNELFDETLLLCTEHSLYAITERLVHGYIPLKGGVRVGVAGEGVFDGGRVRTVKHITSLVVRIPHQIFGTSSFLEIDGYFKQNILIISPPACGKTTLLRDISRRLSIAGQNVVILDERGEISGVNRGEFAMDVGPNADVLFGFPREEAYTNALRALNPDYIITDELSGESDVRGVLRAHYGGVHVIATLHGVGMESLRGDFAGIEHVFDRIIVLSKYPKVGTIVRDVVK